MELTVKAKKQEYRVIVERDAFSRLGVYLSGLSPMRWAIVADEKVAALYGEKAVSCLQTEGLSAQLVTIPAGEGHKTVATYETLCRKLLQEGFSRSDGIVALGGGMVGDLAGFAAATLLRGVTLVQVPTSLLAQVDSAIGGKVGIDVPEGKNLIGAFYPPRMVVVDPDLLWTLPTRQFRSGVAEVIKYGLIADCSILEELMADKPDWTHLIEKCLAIKKKLVEEDEEDLGVRHILNFGHTFGHVYEAMGQYGTYTHGEAVAAGMAQMLRWQCARGIGGVEVYDRLLPLLEKYELPGCIHCDKATCETYLKRDKKARGDRISIVIVAEVENAEVTSVPIEKLLEVAL